MNTHFLAPSAAVGAMGLALVVALVDRPTTTTPATIASATVAWPAAIESGLDHVTPSELSKRMLADPQSVLLIDVRPADEFAVFHLPGAVNLDVVELLGTRGGELLSTHAGKEVVLCSNGMTHPAQAWVELSRRGYTNVRVLEDGLDGFIRDVLTPPSLRGPTTEARAAEEHAEFTAAASAFLAPWTASNAQARAAAPASQEPKAVKPETPAFARLATDPAQLSKPTIVSAAWVAKRGAAVVVLDARDKSEEYAAGHVPGAHHVPLKLLREERDGVPDQLSTPEKLAAVWGKLGIDAETEVVVYADPKLQDSAHVALALISCGHQKVAIVEGGLASWKADGRALATEVPVPAAKTYVSRPAPGFLAVALEDVKKASLGTTPRIVDVRPADAFRGDVSTEARAGHIPRSLNRPYTSDVANTDAGTYWRPLADLRREYEAMGLQQKDPVIITCRTGHQAAQTWFTLRYVLGYEDVRWYDGSWKEWAARTELPIEAGTGGK